MIKIYVNQSFSISIFARHFNFPKSVGVGCFVDVRRNSNKTKTEHGITWTFKPIRRGSTTARRSQRPRSPMRSCEEQGVFASKAHLDVFVSPRSKASGTPLRLDGGSEVGWWEWTSITSSKEYEAGPPSSGRVRWPIVSVWVWQPGTYGPLISCSY